MESRGFAAADCRFAGDPRRSELSQQQLQLIPVLHRQPVESQTTPSGLKGAFGAVVDSDIVNDLARDAEKQETARFWCKDIHLHRRGLVVLIVNRIFKGSTAPAHILDSADPVQAGPEGKVKIRPQSISWCLPAFCCSLFHFVSPGLVDGWLDPWAVCDSIAGP